MKRSTSTLVLCAVLLAPLFLAGCSTAPDAPPPTVEAVAYDTLRQASNLIDAKHALFEVEVTIGKVTTEKEREVRLAYIAANRSIREAALFASQGFESPTPENVDALVAAYVGLVTKLLPPPRKR